MFNLMAYNALSVRETAKVRKKAKLSIVFVVFMGFMCQEVNAH